MNEASNATVEAKMTVRVDVDEHTDAQAVHQSPREAEEKVTVRADEHTDARAAHQTDTEGSMDEHSPAAYQTIMAGDVETEDERTFRELMLAAAAEVETEDVSSCSMPVLWFSGPIYEAYEAASLLPSYTR